MPKRLNSPWLPYLAAVLATVVAAIVGGLLARLVGTTVLYATFFTAVIFAGWYGGFRPALLATSLTYLTANLFFVAPNRAFTLDLSSFVFVFICVAIAALGEVTKRALRRAEASANQVVAIVESITDGFIAIDSRWRCTYMNRAAEEFNHLHNQEGNGQTPWGFFPLNLGGITETKLKQAAAERVTLEFETFYEPWQRWFEIKASPTDDGSLAVFFRDVTERKQAQIALAASEERLRLAQDGAQAGLWDWDMVSGQITWSDEYYEIYGMDRAIEPSRGNLLKSVHPDDRQRVGPALQQAIEERRNIDIEYRIVHPQQGVRWIAARGRTTVDERGRPVRTSGIVLDITERKKAEEALRFLSDTGMLLSALGDFDSTMQKVARLAVPFFADWCVVDMLDAAGQISRVAFAHREQAKERVLDELRQRYPLDWSSDALPVHVLRSGKPELVVETPAGFVDRLARNDDHRRLLDELHPVSFIVVPVLIRDHAIGALSFICSESRRHYSPVELEVATELARRVAIAHENARLYGELKEAQRQKDDFLAMLAHELRNPLAAISYANELSKISDSGQSPASETIDRQVGNLSRLLDDLLDVSRITRDRVQLKKEFIDGADLARRAVATIQPFIEERKHELILEISPAPMPVYADPIRVEQILGNLLTNAAKYTPEGGAITVRTMPVADQVVFVIKDTGIGIAPAKLPRIFELFMQVDRSPDRSLGGLGVGLTVVRKLAEMHGGSVSAKSDGLGLGSEFTIRLPLSGRPVEKTSHAENPNARATALKVLMVDDNVDLAESISKLLKLSGHKVATAHNGHAALEAARSFAPDVVLLDLGLPGIDGYRVAQTLRGEAGFADVRFIAFSGYGQPEDRKRTREAGFDHHLVKPVKFQALLSLIAER